MSEGLSSAAVLPSRGWSLTVWLLGACSIGVPWALVEILMRPHHPLAGYWLGGLLGGICGYLAGRGRSRIVVLASIGAAAGASLHAMILLALHARL